MGEEGNKKSKRKIPISKKFDRESKVDQYNGGMKKVGHDIIEKSLLLLLPGKNGFSKDDLL